MEKHEITMDYLDMFRIIDRLFNDKSHSGRVTQRGCEIQLLKWLFNKKKLDPRCLAYATTSMFPFNYMRKDMKRLMLEEYLMWFTLI